MNSTTHDIARTRIVHLGSAHPRHDIRIFTKQCCSLAACGYQVALVVADGLGDEQRDGVQIVDAGHLHRMSVGTWRVYRTALALQGDLYQLHDPELLPVGLLLKRRGKRVVFDAHEDAPFGRATAQELLAQLQREPGWQRVNTLGQVDRKGVRRLLAQSRAGLVTLHPTANYPDSLPIDMFEYMAAGIPVIASDFPAWREIIDHYQCGVYVDPLDPDAIAGAIDRLGADPLAAQRMGTNGRTAVLSHFYWEREFKSLLALYAQLLDRVPAAAGANAMAPQRGDTRIVARWHKFRAVLSELRRMPRVRLQFQTHLNPAEAHATYLRFTKPHPRFPLVPHKAIGVALVDLVSSLITEKRARFLMYDTYFGASAGLQAFKRMLGFQPHDVRYELLD